MVDQSSFSHTVAIYYNNDLYNLSNASNSLSLPINIFALHFRILTIMLIYNLVNHDLLNYILLYAICKNRPRILIRCAVCSIR